MSPQVVLGSAAVMHKFDQLSVCTVCRADEHRIQAPISSQVCALNTQVLQVTLPRRSGRNGACRDRLVGTSTSRQAGPSRRCGPARFRRCSQNPVLIYTPVDGSVNSKESPSRSFKQDELFEIRTSAEYETASKAWNKTDQALESV